MALKTNCDGFQRDRYFARSWALITQDEGWIKPILLLTLANLVPIVGPLGATGYTVEWARLIAWNTNAAPKQRNVNIGECIVSGWRTFLVYLGWGLLITLAFAFLVMVPIIGPALMFVASIFCIYLSQLLRVAALRASIYQQVGAGYKGGRIWEMGERDVDGLMHIIGIEIVAGVIIAAVVSVVASIVMVAMLPAFVQMVSSIDSVVYIDSAAEITAVLKRVFDLILSFAPAYIIVGLIAGFAGTLLNLILMGATGLWMRQFNVPAWGRSDDPLPQPLPETVFYYQSAPVSPNQGYAYGYGYEPQQQTDYDQVFNQAYEQAYNQAYEQAYGYAPQETAPTPTVDYGYAVPESEPEPAPEPAPAPAPEPEPEPAPEPEPEPEPETAPIPEPETPLGAE